MNLPILDISCKWSHNNTWRFLNRLFDCIASWLPSHWVSSLHPWHVAIYLCDQGLNPDLTLGAWRPSYSDCREVPTWHFRFLSFSIIFWVHSHWNIYHTSFLLWLDNILFCGYTAFDFFIHPLIDIWVVSTFLAIMNSVSAMNILLQIFLWIPAFHSVGYISKRSFWSDDNSVFPFLMYLTFFF